MGLPGATVPSGEPEVVAGDRDRALVLGRINRDVGRSHGKAACPGLPSS